RSVPLSPRATSSLLYSSFPLHPPPPTTPVFPYTTLFRSLPEGDADPGRLCRADRVLRHRHHFAGSGGDHRARLPLCHLPAVFRRSEEHTSELQSRFDLVCRLLLEKKNVTSSIAISFYSLN